MIWKRFEDETPTEAKSVLCGKKLGGKWDLEVWFYFSDEPHGFWDSFSAHIDRELGPALAQAWREEAEDNEWTHWVYVDSPEVP